MHTMKTILSIIIILFLHQVHAKNFVQLSTQLIQKTRDKENVTLILKQLKESNLEDLIKDLDTDNKKKTFWINVYNSYIIFYLRDNPELYQDRSRFFHEKNINIAGELMSFDDIEHGIIRGSRVKWPLGYTKKMFVSDFERKLRVSGRDGRIHFALNCGAKSCPPVSVFRAKDLEDQLDQLTSNYLSKYSTYSSESNVVITTSLMSWFRADFGGKRGVEKFLKKFDVVPRDANPEIQFAKYDWTLDLGNYIDL